MGTKEKYATKWLNALSYSSKSLSGRKQFTSVILHCYLAQHREQKGDGLERTAI